MIAIKDYIAYWNYMKERIPDIKHVFIVEREDQLQDDIKDVSNGDLMLIAVEPSAKGDGDTDNVVENCMGIIYLVKKLDLKRLTRNEFFDIKADTQEKIKAIKDLMIFDKTDHNHKNDKGIHIMHNLAVPHWNIDPEFNYLGTYGYSMSFLINTQGT